MEARRRVLQCILQSPKCVPRLSLVSRQPPRTMASYYTSSTQNGQTDTSSYSEQTRSVPESTTARAAPVQYSEEYYPWGRQLGVASDQHAFGRMESVIDRYMDAINDEYMKREGGA